MRRRDAAMSDPTTLYTDKPPLPPRAERACCMCGRLFRPKTDDRAEDTCERCAGKIRDRWKRR